LEKLEKAENVGQEFKDLLKTRQLAKERQLLDPESDDAKLRLPSLWSQEWAKVRGQIVSGNLLMKRLLAMERMGSNWGRVKGALLRTSSEDVEAAAKAEAEAYVPQEDEELLVRPRVPVFPEDDWLEFNSATSSIGSTAAAADLPSKGYSIKMWTGVQTASPAVKAAEVMQGQGWCKASANGKADKSDKEGDNEEEEDIDFKLFPFDRDLHAAQVTGGVPTLHLARRDPGFSELSNGGAGHYTIERRKARGYQHRSVRRPQPPTTVIQPNGGGSEKKERGAADAMIAASPSPHQNAFACNTCDHVYQNLNDLQYHSMLHSF